ncbi:MAG: DEAD/DEAH box helicase [Armatimonadia bacterium]
MRISSMEAFGVPRELLAVWEREYGQELLPLQERAVVQHRILAGQSVVVQAPTSSGKTFIGEMAATRAALAGRKVLYLVPTKALAEDKYEHFRRLYEPLGMRVIVSTRDRRADDRRFTSGDFDIALAVPEKVRALWARSGVSQFLGVAVVDELQTLGEPERGACLELVLAELRRMAGVQIVGLSACLGTSSRLAEYLGAEWVETMQRPVELRKGVLVGDVFRYRTESGGWAEESFVGGGPEEGQSFLEAAARLTLHFVRKKEATIVFVRDRSAAMRLAGMIAEGLGGETADVGGLEGLETTAMREQLARLMNCGVAAHTADLQFEDRKAVERAFAEGRIKALSCTPTLAMGVNLPAQNVIIDPQGWQAETAGAPSALSPISRGEFENRVGRAGRLGQAHADVRNEFGRGILLADCELARSALVARYLEAQFEAPQPPLEGVPPLQMALNLAPGVHSGSGRTLAEVYGQTFTAYLRGSELPAEVEQARKLCLQRGLMRELADGTLRTTALGRVAAGSGVRFETFSWLLEWARQADRPPTNLEATLLAAMTAEAQEVVYAGGRGSNLEAVRALAEELNQEGALLEGLLTTEQLEWRARERAAGLTMALQRWTGPEETHEVEAAVRVPAARLAALGETVGWLVETLSEIGAELGWAQEACRRLRVQAECQALGLRPEELALGRLKAFGVGRDHVRRLVREGIASKAEVMAAGLERLAEVVSEEAARGLWERCAGVGGQRASERTVARAENMAPVAAVAECPEPEVTQATPEVAEDGPALVVSEDRPDRALFYGTAVSLRPAEFRLLRVLAESAGKCVRYERLYDRMWDGEVLAEPAQVYSHRSRLCAKLARALPHLDPKELLVTVPKHGLLLNLPREEVCVS